MENARIMKEKTGEGNRVTNEEENSLVKRIIEQRVSSINLKKKFNQKE